MPPSHAATPDIIVDQITGDLIDRAWPHITPLLQRGLDRDAESASLDAIRDKVRSGAFQLWAVVNKKQPLPLLAAAATYIKDTRDGRVVVIDTLGGADLAEWMEPALAGFEALAKANGMTRIEIDGRPGWKRQLPGFKAIRIVLQKAI